MAKDRINRDELADKLVERAAEAEDPLRTMAELITGFLMEAEVTNQVGAEAHERTEQRTTHRNGYRDRRWDTRLGTMQLQVPKVREGGYVPSFIEHRKRSEQALISVIQEAVVKGVSTRKIDDVLSYLHYPQPHRVRISSTNPLERLNLEIRRRTRVVGIFPNPAACLRLIGMLLVEKNDDWLTDDKAYLTFDDAPVEESAAKVVSMAASQ